MALTIIKQPAQLILAKQPVAFTADSTNTGTPLRIKANITDNTDADSVAVDVNGQAEFELSDYLQGLITERYKTAATPAIYSNHPAVVQVEFRELVGSPAVVGAEIVSDPFYLLDGYVPKPRRKSLYAAHSSLLAYLVASKSCLSWWPNAEPIMISPTQPMFLNYMQLYSDTAIDITLDLRLYFTNGTNSGRGAQFTVSNVDKYKLVYFPIDYVSLGIASQAALYSDQTLDYYVVAVHTGPPNMSIVISANYSIKPDFTYYENRRILYIRNPFGMLEIVPCTGLGEQTNELRIEVSRTDGHILPDKVSWKYEKSDLVKVNTGFMTKAQMQWLSDMDFLEAYELQGTVLHPIVFRDINLPVVHDSVYQYSAQLEYEYAYNETTEQETIVS